MLRSDVPIPSPHRTYEQARTELEVTCQLMGERLARFVERLAYWEQTGNRDRASILNRLVTVVPADAVRRYETHLSTLCHDFPEVRFWLGINEVAATRHELLRELSGLSARVDEQASRGQEALTALAGILTALGPARRAGRAWTELAEIYARTFSDPIVDFGDDGAHTHLAVPTLGEAYVQPAFRVIEVEPGSRVSEDAWWSGVTDSRDDLHAFLAGYLTNPVATSTPLLVLGHPGAGKSVFSRTLAAQATSGEFRAVRVDLRRVAEEVEIEQQIERTVRLATKRTLDWADLVDGLDGATPVVILDGFDELLQSTATSNSDFLERVCRFQRTEKARGCPVVVIVTSRTAVAHRARIPTGSLVLRLEPFNDTRIEDWLHRWNTLNADYFQARRLEPLGLGTVRRHKHLAELPLLLLMLALYDADDNALQRERGQIAQADLYERLFFTFVEREVARAAPDLSSESRMAQIDLELYRLGIAAYAIFNRAAQYAEKDELDGDLRRFDPPEPAGHGTGPTRHRRLTAAEMLIGRFFFVHVSRSVESPGGVDERTLATYEFLHATFGEYLVASLAIRTVTIACAAAAAQERLSRRSHPVNDEESYALLSFQPLATSLKILEFLIHLSAQTPDREKADVVARLSTLFSTCLQRSDWRTDGYAPADRDAPTRLAMYSLNLLILLVAFTGGVQVATLFPHSPDPQAEWRRRARLWQATLPDEAWRAVVDALVVEGADPAPRTVAFRLQQHTPSRTGEPARSGDSPLRNLARANALLDDPTTTLLLEGLKPVGDPDAMFARSVVSPQPIQILLELVLGPADRDQETRVRLYLAALAASHSLPGQFGKAYRAGVIRRLALEPMPAAVRAPLLRRLSEGDAFVDIDTVLRALDHDHVALTSIVGDLTGMIQTAARRVPRPDLDDPFVGSYINAAEAVEREVSWTSYPAAVTDDRARTRGGGVSLPGGTVTSTILAQVLPHETEPETTWVDSPVGDWVATTVVSVLLESSDSTLATISESQLRVILRANARRGTDRSGRTRQELIRRWQAARSRRGNLFDDPRPRPGISFDR